LKKNEKEIDHEKILCAECVCPVSVDAAGDSGERHIGSARRNPYFRGFGEEIRLKTPEHSFEYLVESIEVVAPTDIQVLEPSRGHDLTFITCFPFYYVGPAPMRFIVHAREVDRMPRE
jgi:hypothetical protein